MGWKAEKKLWALQKLGQDFDSDFLTLTEGQAIRVIKSVGVRYPGTSFSIFFENQRWKVTVNKTNGQNTSFISEDLGKATMSAWLYVTEHVFEVDQKGNAKPSGVAQQ